MSWVRVRKRKARSAKAEDISHIWGLRRQANTSSTVSPGVTSSAYSSPERARSVSRSVSSGAAVLVTQRVRDERSSPAVKVKCHWPGASCRQPSGAMPLGSCWNCALPQMPASTMKAVSRAEKMRMGHFCFMAMPPLVDVRKIRYTIVYQIVRKKGRADRDDPRIVGGR